ncbi:MAG: helix-turn-helix transcriptional regulator [Deltaproteobacteria bacterium]|nr:helix-turn-helix transcriptional regulator [Deltaproteobacteria bacterium]
MARARKNKQTAFAQWLDESGKSRDWAAEKLNVTRQYVDKLCRGEGRPSWELAAQIEKLTRSSVPVSAWVNI